MVSSNKLSSQNLHYYLRLSPEPVDVLFEWMFCFMAFESSPGRVKDTTSFNLSGIAIFIK